MITYLSRLTYSIPNNTYILQDKVKWSHNYNIFSMYRLLNNEIHSGYFVYHVTADYF